jgi:outer membrane protein assembly factor BamB
MQGGGHVEIAGVVAPLTRWSDTLLAACLPETASPGGEVRVFASDGTASNPAALKVSLRPAPQGRILWRFRADADYIESRPAVADDGTIYTIDVSGHLYALAPDGGLKWIFNASGGSGNVSLGADGAIYTGNTIAVFALRPDGSLRWQFMQDPGAFIFLGPNVGPDGNVYAVGTEGMGVFSLAPEGTLRWSVPESYDRPIVTLQEIVFGTAAQSQLYFHANHHVRGLGLDGSEIFTLPEGLSTLQGDPQPAVSPNGTLYTNMFSAIGSGLALGGLDKQGNLLGSIFDRFDNSTNILITPDVGRDGVIYDGRNLAELYAIRPKGTVKWLHSDKGILFAPVVSPLNNGSLSGNRHRPTGILRGHQVANGHSLGRVLLPSENGGRVVPMSRPRSHRRASRLYRDFDSGTVGGQPVLVPVQLRPKWRSTRR